MKRSNVILLSLLATLAVLFASSACKQRGQPHEQEDISSDSNRSGNQLQIAFLTNGPVSDFGYNYTHNEGRVALEQSLGDRVKTIIVESIPETAEAERVMERLIDTGVNVIVATSFGYQDATISVASRHPEVRFLQAWGFKYAPNVGSYSAKMYEVWYLMGIVAGRITKTNKLGIVAAHPVPPMKWQINAYLLGARSVNPNVTATVSFINDWYDPVLSSQAADALINQGHDIICGVLDNSVGVARAAEKRDTWFIGHNTDLSRFAPTRQLVGTRWVWGNFYEDAARMMLENKWQGGTDMAGGLRSGYVGLTDFSPSVPEDVKQEVLVAQRRLTNGEISVYAGPISDNTGRVIVPAGETLTHEATMAIDWLVEGVR